LLTFALDVIPQVRQKLGELQGADVLQRFTAVDTPHSAGRIDHSNCLRLSRSLGIDQRVMEAAMSELVDDQDRGVTFDDVQALIVRSREIVERLVRDRERQIQAETGMSDRDFTDYRQDLLPLYEYFAQLADDNGHIACKQVEQVLEHAGIWPQHIHVRKEVGKLIQEEISSEMATPGRFDFGELLEVFKALRSIQKQFKTEAHREWFNTYDTDRSGFLSLDEISRYLVAIGRCPRTRREQDEMAALIRAADFDGNGLLDFDEFQVLAQRIEEKLQSIRYDEEIEYASTLGFNETQVHEFRWVFETLDADAGGRLDINEVRKGLTILRKKVSEDMLEATFARLDEDSSGGLDFKEFLSLMVQLRDVEGVFAVEAQLFAKHPKDLSSWVMKKCLEYACVSMSYVQGLTSQELLDVFCNMFDVGPEDNIYRELKVNNTGELFEEARKRGLHIKAAPKA
jgi:Ca2+-binding EF-hand superfamily protein